MQVGEGRFADCLTEQLHQEQLGNVPGISPDTCSHHNCNMGGRVVAVMLRGCCRLYTCIASSLTLLLHMPAGVNISPTCIAELEAFKIDRSTNINKDVPLGALLPVVQLACVRMLIV